MTKSLISNYLGTDAEPMTSKELEVYKKFIETEWKTRDPEIAGEMSHAEREFYLEQLPQVIPLILDRAAKGKSLFPILATPCNEKKSLSELIISI